MGLAQKREKAFANREWDTVIAVATKQLESEPNDIKALNDLAEAYYYKKMLTEAFNVCQHIENVCPVSDLTRQLSDLGVRYMRYHLILGEIYYQRGQHDQALQVFQRLKFLKGNFSDKFHRAAQIHAARGQADQAVAEYEQMWRQRPDRVSVILKGMDDLLAKFPKHQKVYRLWFEILDKQGQLASLVKDWEGAAATGTSTDVFRLAYYYQYAKQETKAFEVFAAYVRAHPEDHAVQWHVADALFERGAFDQALQHYRQLLQSSPEKTETVIGKLERAAAQAPQHAAIQSELLSFYIRRAAWPAVKSRVEQLLPVLRSGGPVRAEIEKLLSAAAQEHADTGDLDATRALLEALLLVDPANAGYRAQLGQLSVALVPQRIFEIEEQLKAGRLSEPDGFRLMKELGDLYIQQGETGQKLVSLYQQLSRPTSPYRVEAAYRLGLIFLQQGMGDLAKQQFDRLLSFGLTPDIEAQYCYAIGTFCERCSQPELARIYYKRTYALDVNYKDVAQRLQALPAATQMTPQPSAGTPVMSPQPGDPMAVVRERYDEIVQIGEGGMGSVFRAKDRVLRRKVALKFIRRDYQHDQEAVARFVREAQAASHLRHPGIVAIYDIHIKDPIYIAMEFVEGGSLRDELKRRSLAPPELLGLAVQICDALGYAHQQGVVHRDIKPDNILLVHGGGIKIADFGLARLEEGVSAMTRPGQVMGTPKYMAPEQILGKTVDGRSDIYAVGIMLYEMGTGSVPFTDGDIAYRQIHEEPMAPGLLNPLLPPLFETAIMKCLQKKPENRYQAMDALIRDLKQIGG